MALPTPAWLVSFESVCLDAPACYIWWSVIGIMEMEISILILILACIHRKKLKSPLWSDILRDFQNPEYHFKILNPRKRQLEDSSVTATTWQQISCCMAFYFFHLFYFRYNRARIQTEKKVPDTCTDTIKWKIDLII